MANVFESLWDLFLSLFRGSDTTTDTSDEPTVSLPTKPSEMVGTGPTYCWMDISEEDTETLAHAMAQAGLSIVPLELFGFGQDKWVDNISGLMNLFGTRCSIYNKHGIMVDLKVVNWNWGSGHVENGAMTPCNGRFSDVWFQSVLDGLKPYESGVILQACAEWGANGRNSACWTKAQKWCNTAAGQWKGLKSWNQGSRPGSAPSGHILDWHIDNAASTGPRTSNKLITTDTSGILNWLGGLKSHLTNHVRLTQLVKECKKQGCGFSGYTFYDNMNMEQDLAAIDIIGKAWNS